MSSLLWVSSTTETVHILKLGGPRPQRRTSASGSEGGKGSRPQSSSSALYTSTTSGEERTLTSERDRRGLNVSESSTTVPGDKDSNAELASTLRSRAERDKPGNAAHERKHNGTLMGMLRRTSQNIGSLFAISVGAYLPTAVSEIWEPERDFTWYRILKAGAMGAEREKSPGLGVARG